MHGGGKCLVLATAIDIPAGDTLELSVCYDFFRYWIPSVAATPNRLPSSISDPLLWLVLSDYSNLNNQERRSFTNRKWTEDQGLTTLPIHIQQWYRSAEAPPGLSTRDFELVI